MGAPSSRQPRLESQEVTRARDFLARLGVAPTPDETAGEELRSHSESISKPNASRIATHQGGPGARPASSHGGPIVATIESDVEAPGRTPSSTFSGYRPPKRLVWHDEDTQQEGSIEGLPASVAKAFGSTEHRYRSVDEMTGAIDALMRQTAFDRVVAYASARERSSEDCIQKLVAEGFDHALATESVRRAQRYAIIDDQRFAESFVAAKVRAGWGRRRIERTLAEQHGVSMANLDIQPESSLDAFQGEEERARALLAKKSVPAKNPVEKLARFLITRGFDGGCAFRLARERVAQETNGSYA